MTGTYPVGIILLIVIILRRIAPAGPVRGSFKISIAAFPSPAALAWNIPDYERINSRAHEAPAWKLNGSYRTDHVLPRLETAHSVSAFSIFVSLPSAYALQPG